MTHALVTGVFGPPKIPVARETSAARQSMASQSWRRKNQSILSYTHR